MNYEDALKEVVALARTSGEILMKHWPGAGATTKKEIKEDGTSISVADYESDAFLSKSLSKLFPDIAYKSEESEQGMSADCSKLWIVDPLDGTTSFLNGKDDFSVLIALCEQNQVTLSVMYFPVHDRMVTAIRGGGAFSNGQPLTVSANSELTGARLYCRNFVPPIEYTHNQMDSGKALLSLCDGKLDAIVMEAARFGEHDYAAPSLVIEESGGTITDQKGARMLFNANMPEVEYIIATNSVLHEHTLRFL